MPAFGYPECIYSNQGKYFKNRFVKEACDKRGIQQVFAPVSYLESVGLLERMVQLVISLLRK